MQNCINRLIKCGYSTKKAEDLCKDFINNLSIIELWCFIDTIERKNNVDSVQSKPCR